ncbi:MAG: hypothetical protein P9L93_01660 [Candidatus Gorgyraea atricola]|nr:hypothetical protein [Candidatus Gorgyraea atricola]
MQTAISGLEQVARQNVILTENEKQILQYIRMMPEGEMKKRKA